MENVPSAAAQVIVTVIPIVGIVMGCIVFYLYLYWNHKQKMHMIDKGIVRRNLFDLDSFSLFAGLVLLATGASLVVFFVIKEGFSYGVLSGLIPFSIGLSLIVFFIIRIKVFKRDDKERNNQ